MIDRHDLAVVATVVAAGALYAADTGGPLRLVAGLALCLWAPGASIVRHLRLHGDAARVVAVALSVAVTVLVSEAMVIVDVWSVGLGLAAVAAVALVPVAVRAARPTWAVRPTTPAATVSRSGPTGPPGQPGP